MVPAEQAAASSIGSLTNSRKWKINEFYKLEKSQLAVAPPILATYFFTGPWTFTCWLTLIYKVDWNSVKMNRHTKCLGQRSFTSEVIIHPDIETDTQIGPSAPPEPLKWPVNLLTKNYMKDRQLLDPSTGVISILHYAEQSLFSFKTSATNSCFKLIIKLHIIREILRRNPGQCI